MFSIKRMLIIVSLIGLSFEYSFSQGIDYDNQDQRKTQKNLPNNNTANESSWWQLNSKKVMYTGGIIAIASSVYLYKYFNMQSSNDGSLYSSSAYNDVLSGLAKCVKEVMCNCYVSAYQTSQSASPTSQPDYSRFNWSVMFDGPEYLAPINMTEPEIIPGLLL